MKLSKSETWTFPRCNFFTLDVKHWVSGDDNKWNVYVYFYPEFPNFEDLKEELMTPLPIEFNWGNTYCIWNRNEKGEVFSKCYGSDYQHIHQERFAGFSTKDDAFEVFNDAEEYWTILAQFCTALGKRSS